MAKINGFSTLQISTAQMNTSLDEKTLPMKDFNIPFYMQSVFQSYQSTDRPTSQLNTN